MESLRFKDIIERALSSGEPRVEFIRRARPSGKRVGAFAASFNPVTMAHIEIIRLASAQFSLDETLALAGASNADKSVYDCSLEDRLEMLLLAFDEDTQISIGVSSHAYFTDMIEAIDRVYAPETEIYFIVGFDTFERLLDREDRYTERYHRQFSGRAEALDFLFARSSLIVAERSGAGREAVGVLVESEIPRHADKVFFLDTADDITERSATEVRDRAREGLPISGLVPTAVERYVMERGIYGAGSTKRNNSTSS